MTAARWPSDGKTVVVTMEYRLNLMGWLAHPALDDEGHLFGNYGILDQQLVLKWVKRNIAKFGGDKNNVTLGGQSAGAIDTGLNMVSPLAAGLFQRGDLRKLLPALHRLPTLAPPRRRASPSRSRPAAARARARPPPNACAA